MSAVHANGLGTIAKTPETVEQCVTLVTRAAGGVRCEFRGDCVTTEDGSAITVDWGDGSVDNSSQHTYASTGIYTIRIFGKITSIAFEGSGYVFRSDSGAGNIGNVMRMTVNSTRQMRAGARLLSVVQSSYPFEELVFGDNVRQIGSALTDTNVTGQPVNMRFLMASCELETYAFNTPQGATSFASVWRLPNGVRNIRQFCFCRWRGPSSINVPEGVTTIGQSAFAYTGAQTIELPSTLTSVGMRAFYNDSSSVPGTVICHSTTPPSIQSDTFNGNTRTIYVPSASVSAYQGTTWGTKGTIAAL